MRSTARPAAGTLDFIGLDYYDPFAAHIFRLPVWWDHESRSRSFHDWIMNSVTAKWWDWQRAGQRAAVLLPALRRRISSAPS